MPCRAAAWASAAKSGGPAGGGEGEDLGGFTGLGGELLEPSRGVQGEEPCGGGRDDIGVAKAAGQYRDRAGPGGVFLLAANTRSSPSSTKKVSSSRSWTWTGLALPRWARWSARAKAPPVCAPLTRTWDRAPRNQMAAWASGSEITLPVTGQWIRSRRVPSAALLVREPLLICPGIRPSVTPSHRGGLSRCQVTTSRERS